LNPKLINGQKLVASPSNTSLKQYVALILVIVLLVGSLGKPSSSSIKAYRPISCESCKG